MRKKSHLQKALLKTLGDQVKPFGFTKRREQSFYRPTEFGFVVFHISFINHDNDFDMTADIALRYDSVENLVNLFEADLDEKEKRETCTLGGELGNLSSEHGQHRWTIVNEEDIEPVCHSIIEFFKEVGFPYIEQFSNPENVLAVLSSDELAVTIHCPFHNARALGAVALTHILKGKEAATEMAKKKLAFLQSRKWKENVEPLYALVKHLGLKL